MTTYEGPSLFGEHFTLTLPAGRVATFRVTAVNRYCYHPSHSPDNPWIELTEVVGQQGVLYGCLNTLVPNWNEQHSSSGGGYVQWNMINRHE
jgi:hypothetical protein